MKWTEEEIEKGIKKVMELLGIDRMPTTKELNDTHNTGLSRAINLNGRMDYWRKKLNLERKEKVVKWNDDLVESELRKSMDVLCIDRMPTAPELKSIGRNDLHCRISKTIKYSELSKRLGLERKDSETAQGDKYEGIILEKIKNMGYEVAATTTKHAYDLLANNTVKIEVKSGSAHNHFGSRAFTFGINKPIHTSDIYIIIAVDEQKEIEKILVIPSHELQLKTLNIGAKSKYNKYIDAWHYLKAFDNFYKTLN